MYSSVRISQCSDITEFSFNTFDVISEFLWMNCSADVRNFIFVDIKERE